jgi:uncharacterized protein YndB with AHSA1/START domain
MKVPRAGRLLNPRRKAYMTTGLRLRLDASSVAGQLEAKEGGKHHMSFRNFTTGNSHTFGGTDLKLVPGELLVYTDVFDDPNLPGEMKLTVTLKAVSVGAEMPAVQENVPSVIPAEACILGWQESLRKLAKLIEPDIKG